MLGIAVLLGFTHIPHVYYSQLAISDDSLTWLRIPIGLSQAIGSYAQQLYHSAWHSIHTGELSGPDPLHLFVIMFVVNAFFWSAVYFAYSQWRKYWKRRNHEA